MKLRTYLCRWDFLPHPAKPTLQIGWVFLTTHFPGCSTWSVDILSTRGITSIPSMAAFGSGNDTKTTLLRVILARWKSISFHLGEYLISVSLCRESEARHREAYEKADVSTLHNRQAA